MPIPLAPSQKRTIHALYQSPIEIRPLEGGAPAPRSYAKKVAALITALGTSLSFPVQAQPIQWAIELHNVRSDAGALRVSVYNDPTTFRKEARALKVVEVPAKSGDVRIPVEGLPEGRYAVMAYHDENGDGKLNLRLGMFPLEGYGLSKNPEVFGPPRFEDSALDIRSDTGTVSIDVRY